MEIHSFSRNRKSIKILVLCVVIGFLASIIQAQPGSVEESKRIKIDTFLQVAKVEIGRGEYQRAKAQLIALQGSPEFAAYLSERQTDTIKELLGEIDQALADREKVSQAFQQSNVLESQGKYQDALSLLSTAKNSPYITDQERDMLTERYNEIALKADAEMQKWQALYDASVESFKAGERDKARQGFLQVSKSGYRVKGDKTPEEYILMIDSGVGLKPVVEVKPEPEVVVETTEDVDALAPLVEETDEMKTDEEIAPETMLEDVTPVVEEVVIEPVVAAPAVQEASQEQKEMSYGQVVIAKNARILSYTEAIIKDSLAKAQKALDNNQFDQAKQALRRGFSTIEKNKMLLGDERYGQYQALLNNLDQKTNEARLAYDQEQERKREIEADQLTEQIRTNMEAQRAQAVESYLQRAYAFQKEQRYEEALGQLEQLLAVDPLNQQALIQKQTLEHMVSYIEQRRVIEEGEREEIKVLIDAQRASIPFADEINYPRNWKEIAARREEALKEGMSAADTAISQLLDKYVDLSMLTEDTTLEEAIDIIQTSVDPTLPILVYWSDLSENAFIEKDTPINLSGEVLTNVKLVTGLESVLQAVSTGGFAELDYVLQEGVIKVATRESLPQSMSTKIFDVSDLVHPPANFMFGGGNRGGNGGSGGGMSGGMGGGMMGGGMGGMGGGMGGGMMGGMGGGMMGGMGGMGGGMGGMGGGMGGGMMGGTGNYLSRMRAYELIYTIQQTVEPDTWYDEGGEGRINQYGESKLLIWQTPDVHQQIEDFLEELRKDLGQQIAIEARFLLVAENFLEDIGLDLDFVNWDLGGDFLPFDLLQDSINHTHPTPTSITSSLGGSFTNPAFASTPIQLSMDNLQVELLIRATMAHSNSRSLSAPKAVVLNGESATLDVTTDKRLKTDSQLVTETVTTQGIANTYSYWEHDNEDIETGVTLTITPVISADKKYVILRIITELEDLIDTTPVTAVGIDPTLGPIEDTYDLPTTQIASIMTRVNVPDKGTVMLGGLTLTEQKELESGTPVLAKLPVLGRLFSNRSEVQDKSMLLILVKPTILLQDEQEADAVAALSK